MRHDHTEAPARTVSDTKIDTTETGGRRKRRAGGEKRSSGEKTAPAIGGRRSHRADSRGERSEERHSHRQGRTRDRGRAQRGDVRAAILVLLTDEPMHGYQLMHAIAERTQGAWRPSPGAIYPAIAQLQEEGLVSVVADAGRKLVTLTPAGHEYVEANAATMADPFTAITSQAGGKHDLRSSVEEIATAARSVGKSGTDAQIAKAQEILAQARRDLYRILAEPPAEHDASATQQTTSA